MKNDDPEVYSLLERHEDAVTYRVPDPTAETPAWIDIGLFPWELEGVSMGEAVGSWLDEENPSPEHHEGMGLRVGFHAPTSRHPAPRGYRQRVKDQFDVFSSGSNIRLQNTTPAELRQVARWISLFGFCYWDWVESETDYPIGKKGTHEEMVSPQPETVLEEGVVVDATGNRYETPYELSDIELLSPNEWETPYERAVREIQGVVDELADEVPQFRLAEAVRDVEDDIVDVPPKTPEKERRDELRDALFGDGIGNRTRRRILREFDSVADLCDDLRDGADRLRSLSEIGEATEEAVIDTLVENGEWIPESDGENNE